MPSALKVNEQSQENFVGASSDLPVRRTVLVMGGVAGTGAAICKKMADLGHFVATTYCNEDYARAWQDRMEQEGYLFYIYEEGSRDLVNDVVEDLGPIQILVNDADINSLDSVSNTTRVALDGMLKTGFGRIVNISSLNDQQEFTKALAREVVNKGITVNTVSSGKPEDVAHVVSFLVAEDSGFITGASIAANSNNFI